MHLLAIRLSENATFMTTGCVQVVLMSLAVSFYDAVARADSGDHKSSCNRWCGTYFMSPVIILVITKDAIRQICKSDK